MLAGALSCSGLRLDRKSMSTRNESISAGLFDSLEVLKMPKTGQSSGISGRLTFHKLAPHCNGQRKDTSSG